MNSTFCLRFSTDEMFGRVVKVLHNWDIDFEYGMRTASVICDSSEFEKVAMILRDSKLAMHFDGASHWVRNLEA